MSIDERNQISNNIDKFREVFTDIVAQLNISAIKPQRMITYHNSNFWKVFWEDFSASGKRTHWLLYCSCYSKVQYRAQFPLPMWCWSLPTQLAHSLSQDSCQQGGWIQLLVYWAGMSCMSRWLSAIRVGRLADKQPGTETGFAHEALQQNQRVQTATDTVDSSKGTQKVELHQSRQSVWHRKHSCSKRWTLNGLMAFT